MKGIEASMLREGSYSTLRLGLYEPIKYELGAVDPKTTPLWKNVLAGALAGLLGSGFANPADVIKTRMQGAPEGEHMKVGEHIRDVYSNYGGIRGFYRGVIPTMVRATLLGATYLGTYDPAKHFLINNDYMQEGFKCQFTATVMAGFCVTVATAPADNIKTRIMN